MITNFSNIVEQNEKTIKENNLELKHNIPIGTLVEVKYDEWYDDGACIKAHVRLFIVAHNRDCDGTPLYSLCRYKNIITSYFFPLYYRTSIKNGFIEDDLRIVEETEDIKKGKDALKWKEEELFNNLNKEN